MDRRIAFFHPYPHQFAGAQRLTQVLAHALELRGCTVTVLVPDDGPFPEILARDGIATEIVRAPPPLRRYGGALKGPLAIPGTGALIAYWPKLASALRRLDPDVLHVNNHRGVLLAGPAARLARIPVIWHVHGPFPSRALTAFGVRFSSRALVVSKATLDQMPSLSKMGPRVEVLYNGIPNVDESTVRARSRPLAGRPVLATGARIHPDKGLETLILAVADLRLDFPGVKAYIAGNIQAGYEDYARSLRVLRDGLGLHDAVEFLGLVDDPHAIWAAADVYVQSSRSEPFGLALLEAMQVGVPVVASDVGGIREILADERCGLRVPPDDPVSLASAIRQVLTSESFADALADAGRKRSTAFSEDAMLSRLESVYATVAGESA
jgi:glycosyltransferase involved in cell wall biosynthesis